MYGNFFGLRSLPFEDRADTQFFYPTGECQEALAAMEYEVHHGSGLGLLIGEAGTGKTLLLRTLLLRLQKSDQTVVVTWPASGAMDLVRECCKGFGVALPSSHNQSRCLNRLRRHLCRCAGAGNRSILIVDQAENLSPSNIAQLATLAELCADRGKLLTVILAAQPLVRALLDRPEFAWIRQQLFGERTLSPLTPKETGEYIRHRLQIAGAGDIRLFDDRAISLIHEISEGIPRLINRVCNAAMLVAYAAQTPCISPTIVEEATARPAARERTVAARDLGLAMIGEGGAPWLSVPESPERTASSDESQMTPGTNEPSPQRSRALGLPFESSVTPADIINHEEADDTWSDANVTSGASIADAEYEGFNGESLGSVPNKGTFLLARLERAMARAKRMTSTTEASLTRLAAVEKHLASLVERHTSDVESRLVRVSDIAAQTEDSARRGERACALAGDVEFRLTAFADRLADSLTAKLKTAIDEPVQHGAQLLQEVRATGERITALQQQVASSLIDIGIGCERVTVARAQAGECEQIAAAREGCQAAAKQLEAVVDSASQIHDALQGLVAHADEKVDRLASHHAAASRVLDRLSAANVAGHQVVARIEESGRAVEESTAAQELIERQEQLRDDAHSAAERLAAKLVAATNIFEADEGLLRDFAASADTLRERIEKLDRKTSVLETRIADCTSVPSTIVENAQTQAAQLERVCAAVRKVFANLAEATLKAQHLTEELRGTSEDTNERLAELTAETQRATQTLHEWVEEAVRTQSRLERTLSECPPIRQTHPTEAVRRLSRAVEPFARITAEAAGGQLQVLSEPDFDATPVEPRVAKPPTRTEEISRLISEAKQQEAGAPA